MKQRLCEAQFVCDSVYLHALPCEYCHIVMLVSSCTHVNIVIFHVCICYLCEYDPAYIHMHRTGTVYHYGSVCICSYIHEYIVRSC